MPDCLFCKIIQGAIPAKIVYEDQDVIAFDDISPKAPHHKLIIPRAHIPTLNDLTPENKTVLGHMMYVAQQLAKELDIAEAGYRTIMNCNDDGGQQVYHIHLHLLGGRPMHWPPG